MFHFYKVGNLISACSNSLEVANALVSHALNSFFTTAVSRTPLWFILINEWH